MSSVTLGDMSQSYLFQRRSVSLRTDLARLTEELSSGQVSDVKSVLGGNYSYLADLERSMQTSSAYRIALTEASQFAQGVQLSLEQAQLAAADLSSTLISITDAPLWSALDQGADVARGTLNQIISALNTDMAGRNLFSGQATDTRPLEDMDVLLSELETAVAGQTTAAGIRAAAQAWFDSPTGFQALVYNGSTDTLPPFQVGGNDSVEIEITATDPAIRDLLMNNALSALATEPSLGLDTGEMAELYREAGISLIVNAEQIVTLRGRVGAVEERLDNLTARNESEAIALEFTRNNLLSADPFETANQLETVRFQLESLYTVTARVSNLSLVNYIR